MTQSTVLPASSAPRSPWPASLALLLALVAVTLFAQWGAATSMVEIWWRSETFTHCFLVLPIALWLVWRDRQRLVRLSPRLWWPALLPLLAALSLALLGDLASVNAAQHFGLVFTLQALVALVVGPAVLRAIWFPLVFLLFAPPFGEFLLPQMMEWTADFTIAALRLTGIPVYREGLQFVIPSGHWSVVEACSGVRYLMASVMVGSLFAYLNFDRWQRRLGFVVFATLVPIVANWLRAYFIVLLGHFSGNQLATGADHLVYGWVFFGIIMMAMFWVGSRFADPLPAPGQEDTAATGSAADAAPLQRKQLVLPALALALLVGPALWIGNARSRLPADTPPTQADRAALTQRWTAPQPPNWVAAADPALGWQPEYAEPDLHLQSHWQLQPGEPSVTLDTIAYLRQRKAGRLVSSLNALVPSSRSEWVRVSQGLRLVDGVTQEETVWRLRRGLGQSQDFRVRRVMLVAGQATASNARAKLYGAWQLLRGAGDGGMALIWMTAEGQGAPERLDAFWRDIRPPLFERAAQLGG